MLYQFNAQVIPVTLASELQAVSNGIAQNQEDIGEINRNFYSLSGGIALTEGANLNDYRVPGNFYCQGNAIAETLQNCPVNSAFIMKVEQGTGVNYPTQTIVEFSNGKRFFRVYIPNSGWREWVLYALHSDLGSAAFQLASGNITFGMNGIYIGKFANGPVRPGENDIFDNCIYLIASTSTMLAAYVFTIAQYSLGHLFFNRMLINGNWDFSTWKKLL